MKLQEESGLALVNFTFGSGEFVESALGNESLISCFVSLLNSSNLELVESAVWALGNIALIDEDALNGNEDFFRALFNVIKPDTSVIFKSSFSYFKCCDPKMYFG